jgi:formylglycine-generating enzyme required for sulfatase activity
MGGDLPSSEQWERAARGLYGKLWPSWNGENYPSNLAYLWAPGLPDLIETVEVTEYSGDTTTEGVRDLVGNVSEWTNSQFVKRENLYISVPLDTKDAQAEAVIRGGSWTFTPTRITQVQSRGPNLGSESIGFRCMIPSN